MILATALASSASAATSSVSCSSFLVAQEATEDPNAEFAAQGMERASDGVVPDVVAPAVVFDNTNGDQEAWCYWTVPDDFDSDSASEPTLRIVTWPTECALCIAGLTCTPARTLEYEVSSRIYQSTDTLFTAYGAVDSVSWTFSSQSCGSPCSPTCFQADSVRIGTADITDDSSNLVPGDFVIIRILRDNDVSNNLPMDTAIPLFISLDYPTS